MATAIETLGMSLPYSSSTPAEDVLKRVECRLAGRWAAGFGCVLALGGASGSG